MLIENRTAMQMFLTALMLDNAVFLTAVNCFDVKLSARSQSTMMFMSVASLVVISVSGIVWTVTGRRDFRTMLTCFCQIAFVKI